MTPLSATQLGFFMLDNISFGELFIILFVVYIFFGVKAIPRLFQSLKKMLAELQNAAHSFRNEIK